MRSLPTSSPLCLFALLLFSPPAFADAVGAAPSKKDSPKLFKSVLTFAEFEKAGLSLSFSGLNVQTNGTAPTACVVPGLELSDLIKRVPRPNLKNEDGFQKPEDVRTAASEVGVRFTFKDPSYKSFSDCKAAHENDEGQTDLTTIPSLNRSILLDKEIAVLGFLNNRNKISYGKERAVSADYRKWSDLISRANCTDCNKNTVTNKKLIGEIS